MLPRVSSKAVGLGTDPTHSSSSLWSPHRGWMLKGLPVGRGYMEWCRRERRGFGVEKQENCDRAFKSHCSVSCIPTTTSPKPHYHLSQTPPPLLSPTTTTCISLSSSSGTKDPRWPPHHHTGPARAGQGEQPQGSGHEFGDPTAPSCPSTRRNQAGREAPGLLYPYWPVPNGIQEQ